jgi:V/A-type H+-transporting ATPase subunit I
MAIVPLIKVTLCGPAAEKDAVLDRLQSLACLHLIDLRARAAETVEVEHLDRDAREALQYLRDSSVRRRAQQQRGGVDIEALVKEALDIRGRSRALAEEREQLHKWITDIEPWGDFELPAWAADGAFRFWFYIVPRHQAGCFDAITMPWRIVAQDHRFAYAVVIANEQPANMPVAPVPLEPRSLAKLRMRLAEVERELEELDYRRIGLTLYTEVLRDALDESDDRAARRQAAARALERDQLFAVQGWVPRRQAPALRRLSAERHLALTIEPPSARDNPPTLLDNPRALRGGEGLVEFYTTPSYRLWDPSEVVFFAF